jgi:hypothetical protein
VDSGIWMLRYLNFDATFTIEVAGDQRIADFAKDHSCPVWTKKSEDAPDKTAGNSHHRVWRVEEKPDL